MSLLTKIRIDIDETTRIKVINILNQGVVDAIDLKLQTKQAHWNIKGPTMGVFANKVCSIWNHVFTLI